MRPLFLLLALAFMAISVGVSRADGVGFRRLSLVEMPERPLEAAVWYPTSASGPQTLIGDNAALVGESVIVDAAPTPGRHRLVVLSHGFGGNLGNQAWLAVTLARHGYVVAAVNHPGTTSRNLKPDTGARLWERPRDLSRLIDRITRDPAFGAAADKVGVIGHSLGGWTAMALAGARFDPARFAADCELHAQLAACEIAGRLEVGGTAEARTLLAGDLADRRVGTAEARALLAGDLADQRVGAAVALDLGLARGFTPESLAALKVPVLVMSAGEGDAQVPAALESRYLAAHLPFALGRYTALDGATHFSFLPLCKPGAVALLEAEKHGDGPVCHKGTAAEGRAALHAQVADAVLHFLDTELGAP
ncbi:alpha/beta hydrolase family protein [Ancylobacter sp.]|uniref:alpha/beta hydrolase family protein n=1 Tax=Ancylobacter sp. TaxID=1872567 RepID=UPI003C7E7086